MEECLNFFFSITFVINIEREKFSGGIRIRDLNIKSVSIFFWRVGSGESQPEYATLPPNICKMGLNFMYRIGDIDYWKLDIATVNSIHLFLLCKTSKRIYRHKDGLTDKMIYRNSSVWRQQPGRWHTSDNFLGVVVKHCEKNGAEECKNPVNI